MKTTTNIIENTFAEDNKLFVSLLEKHEDDTEFINPEDASGFMTDDNTPDTGFAPYCNAWHEMKQLRDAMWVATHDWAFGIGDEYWDCGVFEIGGQNDPYNN